MALLTGNTIASSYLGILNCSGAISTGAVEVITDAANTSTALWLSNERCEIKLGTGGADDFIVKGNTTAIFTVEGDTGDVGIGTTDPQYDLDVVSDDAASEIRIRSTDTDDNAVFIIDSNRNGDSKIQFRNDHDDDGTSNTEYTIGIDGSDSLGAAKFKWANNSDGSLTTDTRMTLDAAGYLGIGITSPNTNLHVVGTAVSDAEYDEFASMVIEDGEARLELLGNDSGHACGIIFSTMEGANDFNHWVMQGYGDASTPDNNFGIGYLDNKAGGIDSLTVADGAQMFTITAAGRVSVNDTNPDVLFHVNGGAIDSGVVKVETAHTAVTSSSKLLELGFSSDGTCTGGYYCRFYDSGGEVGSIKSDGTGVDFNDTSDYRLKEDLKPVSDAVGTLNKLNIYDFKWKNTGARRDGLLAHEVMEVIPYAASGEKDATEMQIYEISPAVDATYDSDGKELTAYINPVKGEKEVILPQQINYGKFVPLLVKAVQELSAKVTALENA